jgi:6-phosphogluconolactonase
MFLVSGAGKATMVREILENHPPVEKHPAVGVRPRDGKVIWMLDEAAGKLLKKNL